MSRRRLLLALLLALALLCVLGAAMAWRQFNPSSELQDPVAAAVRPYRFDLFRYEVRAVAGKLGDGLRRLGARLAPAEQRALVQGYQRRAREIGRIQQAIDRVYADPAVGDPAAASAGLQARLAALRERQQALRPLVEATLERQIAGALQARGLGAAGVIFPPVRFNFSDLPNYLIVSPRDRIALVAGVHLRPDLGPGRIEAIEDQIAGQFDRSTLIEPLGGLGVWPTMVQDDAGLAWILSTIAHEWVHNYMVFQPLGWHMFDSPGMNTINETVATIAGDELGQSLAESIYGIPPPPPPLPGSEIAPPEGERERFDFRQEMRRTRLRVDELLAGGRVQEAERYMEARRRLFVEHGYNIRKLNQAYFAFHGSYATTPASTDPIGPKLLALRAAAPDLATFLQAVQEIAEPADLDALLAAWQVRPDLPAPPGPAGNMAKDLTPGPDYAIIPPTSPHLLLANPTFAIPNDRR